jgi:putative peptide zinc metalloprotease protein
LAWREFTSTRGESYVVVQNPLAHTYRRLSPEEFFLFRLMDGSKSVQQLVVAYMMEFHRIALQGIAQLVQELRNQEMLEDPPYETYRTLSRAAGSHSLAARASDILTSSLNHEYPIGGMDALVARAYRFAGWSLFTSPGQIILALIALIGVPLLIWNGIKSDAFHAPGVSPLEALAAIALFMLAITAIHEAAHALAVKSYGRSVPRGGFAVLNGFPGLFVDTQDIWMEPRGARIAVSWAGPYSGFILAGASGIVLTFLPPGSVAALLRLFGFVALAGNAVQLMPLVRLDGYFMLMDWLDLPNLRARSLTFIRHDLWSKAIHRRALNREERIFALFGSSALAYSAGLSLLIAWIILTHASDALQLMRNAHSIGAVLIAILAIAITAPFAAGMSLFLVQTGRSLLSASARLSSVAKTRRLRQRVSLLTQVAALARFGDAALESIAFRLREERPVRGTAIVRQGEAGDRFYLIVDGHAGVYHEDSNGSSLLAELGPSDYFGERSLLERAPRAATVRAESNMRLLSLGAREFLASIKEYIAEDVDLRAGFDELAEMDKFPLLQPLGSRERQILLRYLHAESFQRGDRILRENDYGDTFYLLRSGTVAVSRQNREGAEVELQTLSAGDFFGEIALLTDLPRIATVRALDDVRVWTVDRRAFQNLLGQYFNVGDRLMPVARTRLMQDRLIAAGGDEIGDGPQCGAPAPALALDQSGGSVSLDDYRGRKIAIWFSPECSEPEPSVAAAIGRLRSQGIVVLRIVPNEIESGEEPGENSRGYVLLSDLSRRSFRSYGMCTQLPRSQPGSDSPWNAVMSQLSSERNSQTDLYEIREGVAIIDSGGRVERIQLVVSPEELVGALNVHPDSAT